MNARAAAAAGFAALLVVGTPLLPGCTVTGRRATPTPEETATPYPTSTEYPSATPPQAGTWTPFPTDTITLTRTITRTPTITQTFTITLTPTPAPPTPTAVPSAACAYFEGFEGGTSWPGGWTAGSVGPMGTPPCPGGAGGVQVIEPAAAYAGSLGARLGDNAAAGGRIDFCFRDVAVPATGSPALSFWWRHFNSDYGGTTYDWFRVRIYDLSCTLLTEVLAVGARGGAVCNTTADSGWVYQVVPLSAYAGQTVRIWFGNREDGVCAPTYTYLDDVCIFP